MDIVIHAPAKSSGSLIRLLRSIETADYFGSRRPHLPIELPAEIDRPTSNFLENLVWPPLDASEGPHASQVTLRHRLPRHRFTAEEVSTHLVESFYPARPKDSHVLLLSPQVELSSIYYHYVMYNLLQYKYATFARMTEAAKNLMGFSLELPSVYLNNSGVLEPPTIEDPPQKQGEAKSKEHTPFLWQAPNSNAALYFGDKWVELHSFLSARIATRNPHLASEYRSPSRPKIISEYYPSWMEYVQELMRTRGYSLLYPYFPANSDAVVTVHNELYQLPEEYSPTGHQSSPTPVPSVDPNDPFVADPSASVPTFATSKESPLITSNLLSLIPESGQSNVIDIVSLPILSHDGNLISPSVSGLNAETFANNFRREIGRCDGNELRIYNHMSAEDLFCNLDWHKDQHMDPLQDKHENHKSEQKPSREVVGSPVEFSPEQGKGEVKTSLNEGESVTTEFAAHLGRQNPKVAVGVDENMKLEAHKVDPEVLKTKTKGEDDIESNNFIAEANTAADGSSATANVNAKSMESKEKNLKAHEEIVPNKLQDITNDPTPQDPQVVLESKMGTPTEPTITPGSPSPSAAAQAEPIQSGADFVPPVRHRGW